MDFKFSRNIFYVLTITFMVSCGSDNEPMDLSNSKAITSFIIAGTEGKIDELAKTISITISDTDLTGLIPSIITSEFATVSPESGIMQNFTNAVVYTVTAEDGSTAAYTISVNNSITSFTANGVDYELVQDNRNWVNAAAFAVTRGGKLAEINSTNEQNAIFAALNDASIFAASTSAPDGGDASYVWIGGNDMASEGDWIWDGDNNQMGDQFWDGAQNGVAINGRYNNWGNEPDNFGSGQDAVGIAITDWPRGTAGEWNDLSRDNKLYFLIELN